MEYSKHDSNDIANRIMKFYKNFNRYNKDVESIIKEKYDWRVIDKRLYNTFQGLLDKYLTNK